MCPEEDDPRPAAEGEEERRLPAHLTGSRTGAFCCYEKTAAVSAVLPEGEKRNNREPKGQLLLV